MGQFGEDLRRERESRGIALERITDITKISVRHLNALEQEQFEQLPGGVFNKGIMRSYARVVGLNEDAWLERFTSAYQASGLVKDDEANWVEFAENIVKNREPDPERPEMRLRWLGVLLLVLLVSGLGWFVYQFVLSRVSTVQHGERPLTAQSEVPMTSPPLLLFPTERALFSADPNVRCPNSYI
ncbi:MAG: helix-turn-helix domain-containing protein [Acetobacteraceae bacterium]|nr:helix-turn-helix domain-containing protein [Acetobacteraceae bacterium]